MELSATQGVITHISADELRRYLDTHRAAEYLLIDVREPEEYSAGHIPGAHLLPVLELDQRFAEIEEAPAGHKIFYCRSGGRSKRAAEIAVSNGVANVVNVRGGMLAWRGEKVLSLPSLRAFDDTGTLEEVLVAALDLEKGAHRLYERLHETFTGTSLEGPLKRLTWVEVGHERLIYAQLEQRATGPVPPFEELMGKLRGDVLESGEALDDVLATARKLAVFGGAAVLELALELELRALDMYRALAQRASDPEHRQVFLGLADQEHAHAREVLDTLVKITGDQSTWMG